MPPYYFFFFHHTATTEIYTFPYTTLFRSLRPRVHHVVGDRHVARRPPPLEHVRRARSEEHTSELQSRRDLVCRLLLEKKKKLLYLLQPHHTCRHHYDHHQYRQHYHLH